MEAQLWRQRQRIGKHGGSMAYADDDCNGNDDNYDWLLIASPSRGRGGRGRRIDQASIQPWSCRAALAGGDDSRAATAGHLRDCWGLPPPPLQAVGVGGGGWPHAPPPVLEMDGNGNGICNCLREKGVGKGEGEGELNDGFVFHAVLICYSIFGLPFSMQVDWFYIKFKSIVGWAFLARFLFQSSKFGHHISVWQL
jgi:hypothetical protein